MERELETRKFPNGGFDVTVLRKSDVLRCIDDNVIDKDIAMIVVTQCELDAIASIRKGKIASIPHIGTIRYSEASKIIHENAELLDEAANSMDKERYLLFRRQVIRDGFDSLKQEKYFNYCVAKVVTKNRGLYFRLAHEQGETQTRLQFFFMQHLKIINSNE